MSRYLGEITNQRQHSYAFWRTNQLERRPAPPTGTTSAFAWARFQRKSTTDITVTNGTNIVVAGTAGDDLNTDSSIFQINSHQEIQMLVAGLVGIWGQTVWGTYDTTFRQVAVYDVAPAVDVVIAEGGSANDLYDPVEVAGIVRVAIGAKLKLVVNQHSGAGQTLYGGGTAADEINFLEVQYLGPYQ